MKTNIYQKQENNWKIVRNRVCIRALLIFLGVLLMQMLAYMVCVVGLTGFAMAGEEDFLRLLTKAGQGEFLVWVSLVSAFLSMIWCGILYKKSDWRGKDFDYRSAFCLKNTLSILGIGVGSCIVLTMFLSFMAMVMPQAFESYNTIMDSLTDTSMVLTLVYVMFVGPISEELIFRGAILDRFYLAFPFLFANILQAVLFGLYHMNLIQGLYAFCLGVLLGMIRHATGSIFSSMLAHIVFNSTSFGLDIIFPSGEEMQIWKIVVLVLAGIIACVFSIRHLWKEFKRKEDVEGA